MPNKKRTERIFDLIRWLNENKSTGIQKKTIIDEYEINEKTFLRDVDFLQKTFPNIITYDKDYNILSGFIKLDYDTFKKLDDNLNQELSDKINIFNKLNNKNEIPYVVNIPDATEISLKKEDLSKILEAIFNREKINIYYHKNENKEKLICYPLFFSYFPSNWYLFVITEKYPKGAIKLKLDRIAEIENILIDNSKFIVHNYNEIKDLILSEVKESKNIFNDFTHSETPIKVTANFFISKEYLKGSLPQNSKITLAKENKEVLNITLPFTSYMEAQMFFNKWLGHFSIIGPKYFREKYINDLEEYLDMI